MDFIWNYITSSLMGIIIGAIFLILGILFLPESITYKFFTVLKPNLLLKVKSYFKAITRLLIFNEYNNSENEKVSEDIQKLNNKLKHYEEAYFLIDSIEGLFEVLAFVVEDYDLEIYEQVSNYFGAYSAKLMQLKMQDISMKIYEAFEELGESICDIHAKYKYDFQKDEKIKHSFIMEKKKAIQKCFDKIQELKTDIEAKMKLCKKEIYNKTGKLIEDIHL